MTNQATLNIHPGLNAQREYTSQLALQGQEFALVAAEAFVRGIRDIGYKSTATALDELIDNAIQAGSARVDVAFGYGRRSTSKPDRIAVIDDGHGMDPDMMRASVMWGGTHRENDRTGFGRYGYGLPSACVSQGTRFVVYSRPDGGVTHEVELDIEKLGSGEYHSADGRVEVPPYAQAELPFWIKSHLQEGKFPEAATSGTVVVLDKLDRLSWVTTANLERNLLQHFGVTYRQFLQDVEIRVNNKRVDPIDPLFITEGFRHFDADEGRAKPLEPLAFDMRVGRGTDSIGTVNVRYSTLPVTFASIDKSKPADGRNANGRFGIMKDHAGIIFLRNGRQIDVVTKIPWIQIQNNDRYWNVEVDFSPDLDEEFAITTSKQQVVVSDRMWEVLKNNGMLRSIEDMRREYRQERAKDKAETDDGQPQPRASEKAMEESQKFKTRKPSGNPIEREIEAEKNILEEANRRARRNKQPLEEATAEILAETASSPFRVREEDVPGGPFFRPQQLGGQFVLWINTAHKFYTSVYAAPGSTGHLRDALELMLFTLGESELDSFGDRRLFYQAERQERWTTRLTTTLELLEQQSGIEDDQILEEEIKESAVALNGAESALT